MKWRYALRQRMGYVNSVSISASRLDDEADNDHNRKAPFLKSDKVLINELERKLRQIFRARNYIRADSSRHF